MHLPRIMIAGMASGSGKTTITCGILKALKNRNLQLSSSKCGPDYIDPMFHSKVLDINGNNLDAYFCSEQVVRDLLGNNARNADIAVIEGVMGYYDGISLMTDKGSSYDIAQITSTPVIMIVQCKGIGRSIIPLIKGMIEYQSDSNIKGVILNGITEMLYRRLKEIIEEALPIKVCGYFPKLEHIRMESRHLGLITPHEITHLKGQIAELGRQAEACIDIDRIIKLAGEAPELKTAFAGHKTNHMEHKPRIGIAYDKAFCFYYKDNLELLESLGCELVYFSPLMDTELPVELQGIIFGGGYPELYGKELEANATMKACINNALLDGTLCLAECGGFMYLQEEMEDVDGNVFQMVGYIKGKTYKTDKLVRFGYIQLVALEDNKFQKKGEIIKGHEFHYWDSTNPGSAYRAVKPFGNKQWECSHAKANVFAGYPHIHYYSNLKFIQNFVESCQGRIEK